MPTNGFSSVRSGVSTRIERREGRVAEPRADAARVLQAVRARGCRAAATRSIRCARRCPGRMPPITTSCVRVSLTLSHDSDAHAAPIGRRRDPSRRPPRGRTSRARGERGIHVVEHGRQRRSARSRPRRAPRGCRGARAAGSDATSVPVARRARRRGRSAPACAASRARSRAASTRFMRRLQPREARSPLRVERDDLAVDDGGLGAESGVDAVSSGYFAVMSLPLRARRCRRRPSQTPIARMPSHLTSTHGRPSAARHRARCPGVLDVASIGVERRRRRRRVGRGRRVRDETPCAARRLVAARGVSRADGGARGAPRAPRGSSAWSLTPRRRSPSGCGRPVGIRLHAMQQPRRLLALAVGADQREPHAAERSAGAPLGGEDDLVVAPLLELVPAVVPDRHRAAAVLAARDRPLERRVLHRVVLGHDREVVALVRVRDAARHRPAHEHAVALEAEVPVQRGRVVLLDDEARQLAGVGVPRRAGSTAPARASCPPCAWRCSVRAGRRRRVAAAGVEAERPPAGRRSSRRARAPRRTSRCARSGSSSSSHVRGAATVGSRAPAQRVRARSSSSRRCSGSSR